MRLLIIEDSVRLRESLVLGFRKLGHVAESTGNGAEGLWMAKSHDYDTVILDLMLPDLDGMTLLKNLRTEGRLTPVLVLTAKDAVDDRIAGLRTGADDYLTKPFSFDELAARIEAIVRRHHSLASSVIQLGRLKIDLSGRVAFVDDNRLDLTAREYMVLEYLMQRQSQIVSRAAIEARLYDHAAELTSNVIDTVIYALRKKLEVAGVQDLIHTIRGMGYELREEKA